MKNDVINVIKTHQFRRQFPAQTYMRNTRLPETGSRAPHEQGKFRESEAMTRMKITIGFLTWWAHIWTISAGPRFTLLLGTKK